MRPKWIQFLLKLLKRPVAPRYRLEDLAAEITPDYQPETIEFPPVGEENL